MSATCVRCGRPMPDVAYACSHCASELADALQTAAGHAEDAEAVIARQARYGGGGGSGGYGDGLTYDEIRSTRLASIRATLAKWTTRISSWKARADEPDVAE
jgi:hypothetical protein